jgi:DNA-binding transcriptional LysR family regulator
VWTAKLPEQIIHNDLKVGRLVKVIPNWEPKPELIQLAYTSRRSLLPSVKALIDFLVTAFEKD